jgi:glyoxylase-like metal-dependent hydrolase (beta-lactamase superfamily II)
MLLKENNLVELVDGEKEIVKGITISNSGGHTPGHQIVFIDGGKERIIYAADLIPTTAHLRAAYVAGVDLYPRETMQVKKEIIKKCLDENWMLALDHDVNTKLCRLRQEDGRIVFEKVNFK